MTVGKWTIRRPRKTEIHPETEHLNPLKRGLVVEWSALDDKKTQIATFPVPHYGWAWAWPWILYKSIRVIQRSRAVIQHG